MEMKKIKYAVATLMLLIGFMTSAQAQSGVAFDHTGIQKGTIFETCYNNPCSLAKFDSYKIIEKTQDETLLRLSMLGGSRESETMDVDWNKSRHSVIINCSYTRPIVQVGDQSTLITLNDGLGVFDVIMVAADLYLKACHNFEGFEYDAVTQYGYDVHYEE